MKKIWKHKLSMIATNNLDIGQDAKICHFGIDCANDICLWSEHNDDERTVKRIFIVVGTGEPFIDNCKHRHSIIDKGFVWHLLEVL